MLAFLSLFGFLLSFALGYMSPVRAGWATIMLLPILGPGGLCFVSSSLLPLTAERVAFAVTVGVLLKIRGRNRLSIRSLFKIPFVKIVVLFSAFVILISLEDRLKNIVFTYIPDLFVAFVLCYVLIKNEKDLRRLVTIFVMQGLVIAVMILLEHFMPIRMLHTRKLDGSLGRRCSTRGHLLTSCNE